MTPKDTNAYSYNVMNKLYLVYKVGVRDTFSNDSGSYDQVNTVYWYISFHDLMVGQDGKVTVNLSDYGTPSDKFTIDSGLRGNNWFGSNQAWYYHGYETLDELYKAAVTKNMDAFNHEDNVTDNV